MRKIYLSSLLAFSFSSVNLFAGDSAKQKVQSIPLLRIDFQDFVETKFNGGLSESEREVARKVKFEIVTLCQTIANDKTITSQQKVELQKQLKSKLSSFLKIEPQWLGSYLNKDEYSAKWKEQFPGEPLVKDRIAQYKENNLILLSLNSKTLESDFKLPQPGFIHLFCDGGGSVTIAGKGVELSRLIPAGVKSSEFKIYEKTLIKESEEEPNKTHE